MSRRYFGTDGIRGRVGEPPITADFVMKLGWAAGQVLGRQGEGRNLFLVGKDTRVSGYMFESALEAGLIAAGAEVGLLGPMPTPAIAYLTRTFRARAGIVISASHNPHFDNGIKFFSGDGFKLPDTAEEEIESYLEKPLTTEDSENLGRAFRVDDAAGRYIEYCKSTVPRGFVLSGLKLVVDCANGATYHVAPNVFRELGARVVRIGTEPDGLNINSGCGSTQPELLSRTVVAEGADLGIALDGDGDRVLLVDANGRLVDGDELLFILSDHRARNGGLAGVVGTLMSNFGLEQALGERGIPFLRAPVGDRYVIEAMREKEWPIGGESSGHLICGDLATTGDGIVAALQVLVALRSSGQTLAEARSGMTRYPQKLVNVRVAGRLDPLQNASVRAAVEQAEAELAKRGRVLLRASGTEPLIRVMVEGESSDLVERIAGEIAGVVESELGS